MVLRQRAALLLIISMGTEEILACTDYADELYGTNGACAAWIEKYSCDELFCESGCMLSGYCDATCGYCASSGEPSAAPAMPPSHSPTTSPTAPCSDTCVDEADEMYGTTSTCAAFIDGGLDCTSFFCVECGFAGYCDLTCDFCTSCDRRKRRLRGAHQLHGAEMAGPLPAETEAH